MNRKQLIIRSSLTALIITQGAIYFSKSSPMKTEDPSATTSFQLSPVVNTEVAIFRDVEKMSRDLVTAHQEGGATLEMVERLEELMIGVLESQKYTLQEKLRLFEKVTDVDLRDRLSPDVIAVLTRELSIDQALAVGAKIGVGKSHEEVEEIVATRFEVEPEESLQWLARSEDFELKRTLLPELVSQWAVDDTAGAAGFLEQLPESEEVRDLAIGLFVHAVLRENRREADRLLVQVSDAKYREYLREEIELFATE